MSKRDYQLLGEVTNDDIMFLCRANIDFYREPPEIYDAVFGDEAYSRRVLIANPKCFISTYNDKETSWINIYFGERLILLSEVYQYK